MPTTLRKGDQVPHFEVTALGGEPIRYAAIWQHRNLVLVTLPADGDERQVAEMAAREQEFRALKTVCVVTRDRIEGVPVPGTVIADRWGEIVHVAAAASVDALPTASELLEWMDYVERRCPECEGETK